ncbi:mitogen-activated protein kinase kinase kinase 4-like isoform X2 [Oncorhynchus tshawytscha]|uniref:Mitogen-activated protein kinase kinase kinase 4 n=1 Tax=Oncorhynchus tshawytscha TaxID=74940 RepID=A0AAZ3QUI7_ONCTS|nr:mitogen-activated protein kinase kinase kinase 4-like isoform X2 [Oncorhynchus tshawytscha]
MYDLTAERMNCTGCRSTPPDYWKDGGSAYPGEPQFCRRKKILTERHLSPSFCKRKTCKQLLNLHGHGWSHAPLEPSIPRPAMEPPDNSEPSRQVNPSKDGSAHQSCEVEDFWYEPSEEEEALYGTSPPYTSRQMKRMSGKHQKNSQARSAGRSPVGHTPNKIDNQPTPSSPSQPQRESEPNPYRPREGAERDREKDPPEAEQHNYKLGKKQTDPSEGIQINVNKATEEHQHNYKQGKRQRATLRSSERDHKKTFEGSFMLDPLSKTSSPFGGGSALNMDPRKPYLSLGCGSGKLPVTIPHPMAHRTHRQTSRTDCPADRLKFFETLRLLLKLTSMSSKKKEKEQRGLENSAFMGQNNEVVWLELQAWHARRSVNDQDLFLFTARQAIPDIINKVLHFKVNYHSLSPSTVGLGQLTLGVCVGRPGMVGSGASPGQGAQRTLVLTEPCCGGPDQGPKQRSPTQASETVSGEERDFNQPAAVGAPETNQNHVASVDPWGFSACPSSAVDAAAPLGSGAGCREHLQRQRLAFEQVKRVMELLESVEALYPSLQTLQKDYEKYAARDFQGRVQALCLWLNITQDLNQKLRVMATVLGLGDLSRIGWPVFEIPSPRCSRGNDEEDEDEEDEENDSTATFTAGDSDGEDRDLVGEEGETGEPRGGETTTEPGEDELSPCLTPKFAQLLLSEDGTGTMEVVSGGTVTGGMNCPTAIFRPFVDKALKQMGLRKLILRLHKLMDPSLQRSRAALLSHTPAQEFTDFPDPMLYSDYLPELSRHLSSCSTPGGPELGADQVSWEELLDMDLPSFRPAFLVLCRVLLNVIHECLKLRLEQRPAGEPSLLSIKQLVRECKEVLKGGLLMKQYYQYMLRGVVTDPQGLQTNANIDEFEEDLHKMLVVYFDYMHSWIQMLQQLPQASHSLKNLLEEEWNFSKVITPYIRRGEAQSGKLFCDIAGMLLKSTGDFLDTGLQKSGDEFWESADDSTVSDEIRRSVIETSRSLKELFHEARERASKALGFAKMLRKDLEIAADFSITSGVPCLLEALKERNYVKVQIPGLEELEVFVPCALMHQRDLILQLLNAAAGKDCSKEPDEMMAEDEAYLLMSKHGAGDPPGGAGQAGVQWHWDGKLVKLVPQMETVDTLRAMKVENLLLIVMQSAHLVAQRKAFQQSMDELLTLSREQTSSQPLIARSLEQLKNEALQLCRKINTAIDRVEFMFTSEFEAEVEESESATLQQYYREAMIQGYNFAFEYHKEVVRLMSGEFRQRIGECYIAFARKWMNYVLTKCESGRGTRPRWATQGFDFLQAIEPAFISALPEDDFLNLQALMNECIGHVIGKPHSPVSGLYLAPRNSPRPVKVPRCHSDPPNPHLFIPNAEGFRGANLHENDRLSSVAAELQFKSLSRHSSPTDDREEPSYPKGGDPSSTARRSWELRTFISQSKDTAARQSPMEAVRLSIRSFEDNRYAVMKQRNIIGQVCHTPKSYDNVMHVGLRKVTFKWQRGNKIGEGQYGKVYTCINVDTGELMAMKEIRFQPNDHKTIKETADELKIFEGIKHPNLVRYFGVELHREEMYIFMEYCDEGTLEEVSRLGLQEHVIRLYSKQTTTAINVLHEHGIVHRDIKGANIFLTSSGLIKLGDFGCSVKLNNAQTMPGEVNSTMGTAAYMAPEVITRAKGEGHGRAADIWSLGCVLIEMVTGKRPWHEYEHNFQIMYKVGMGHKPPIPEKLSTEGKDFLGHCLESEPKQRWTASTLLDHPFVKVCTDEE